MQTYYQKHKTIQAFQFDGTWQQLENNFPHRLWCRLLSASTQGQSFFIQYDHDNQIQSLKADIPGWSQHSQKYAWPAYMKKIPKFRHKKRLKNFRYPKHYVVLHPGDYVTIVNCYSKTSNSKQIRKRHRPIIFGKYVHWWPNHKLKIIDPADFEAHWSKTPIKK